MDSHQVVLRIRDCSSISGGCWDRWNVDVTVNEGEGAIPVEEFDMQGHPDLGDSEGGAGVLLAVAGSLMREQLTSVFAAIAQCVYPHNSSHQKILKVKA